MVAARQSIHTHVLLLIPTWEAWEELSTFLSTCRHCRQIWKNRPGKKFYAAGFLSVVQGCHLQAQGEGHSLLTVLGARNCRQETLGTHSKDRGEPSTTKDRSMREKHTHLSNMFYMAQSLQKWRPKEIGKYADFFFLLKESGQQDDWRTSRYDLMAVK